MVDHMYFHRFRHLGRHLEFLKMLNDDSLSSSRILNCNVLPTRIHQEKNFIPNFQVHQKYAIFVPDYLGLLVTEIYTFPLVYPLYFSEIFI